VPSTPTPQDFLPLKDLVFRILVLLGESERHGWGLGQALAVDGGPVLPGQLYRTLDAMLEDGLIDEHDAPRAVAQPAPERGAARGAAPTRFFRLTPFGRKVAHAETARLAALLARSRAAGFSGPKPR
jgi:DNA-binding PadR family transcriptional regulator